TRLDFSGLAAHGEQPPRAHLPVDPCRRETTGGTTRKVGAAHSRRGEGLAVCLRDERWAGCEGYGVPCRPPTRPSMKKRGFISRSEQTNTQEAGCPKRKRDGRPSAGSAT